MKQERQCFCYLHNTLHPNLIVDTNSTKIQGQKASATTSKRQLAFIEKCDIEYHAIDDIEMDQSPVKIGQYVLGKNLGIGAFGKVGCLTYSH